MIITTLLFILILGVLVLVHEGGHFLTAKRFGIKVHEFAIGFPPKLFSRKKGETEYSINLLPIGGFVRIEGEDATDPAAQEDPRSFASKPLHMKLAVVLAGVVINWVVAALIFGFLQTQGAPVAIADTDEATDASVVIAQVAEGSPGDEAGIMLGDSIVALEAAGERLETTKAGEVQEFLAKHVPDEVAFTVERGEETREVVVPPRGEAGTEAPVGIFIERVTIVAHPWYEALWRGTFVALSLTWVFAQGFFEIFRNLFVSGELAEGVAGPVGIAVLVGEVRTLGATFLLNLVAIFSLNLALLNLLPIPGLDGGRAVLATAERFSPRTISKKGLAYANALGLALVLLALVLITIRDVQSLF